MSRITQLDNSIDLWIGYSWFDPTVKNATEHGICGHTFELIEYFWKLKETIKCAILWPENNPKWEVLETVIRGKYNFTEDEIQIIKEASYFKPIPKMIKGNNIILVDGEIDRIRNSTLLFKNIIMFSCGDKDIANRTSNKKNYTILQDESNTSYGKVYEPNINTIHYKKKLLLNRYKELTLQEIGPLRIKSLPKTSLLYLPGNCRSMKIEDVRECLIDMNKKYETESNRGWLIATDDIQKYKELEDEFKLVVQELPIKNFHEQFDNFVYTSLERKWDCSNRLLVECKHYKKTFQFQLSEDYYKDDKALLARRFDLSNIDNLNLDLDNDIAGIIKGIIC